MNRVSVIVRNPAYIGEVELDEDRVNLANLVPLVSGNTPITTVPASEDEDVAEEVVEDKDEDEKMEDIPQILLEVVQDLEELNRELRSIMSRLLGTLAPNSPLLAPMFMYGTQGRLWSKSTDCILPLLGKRLGRLTEKVLKRLSGSCRSGLTSRPVVQEYERAVIFRLGRLLSGGSRGPGIFFVLPCIESYQKVDLRTITLGVPPQEVLTKDSVTVSVDAVVYYRVSNATVSVANVENAHHSTRLLAQTTLRNILGTKNLHEILSDRESISGSMQTVLDEATTAWGIKVERVEIKDARLPVQLQRAMAAEAEAAREARAKVIAAEGEQKASRALREASEVIAESSAAFPPYLSTVQTLNSISAEKNSTIIFPLPIDLITHLLSGKGDKSEKPEKPKDE
ncbi:band 7 protein AGAP004871 [Eurytemora carolleeae]|uniref:band 7 protein AGAP004871 n=1 Tax=Eurytemora carolleeae TaxID=1294199 RepID=UPI000C75B2EA|nr:band 7 protein AGAP004871 [Eurytemora carolleeae]|eukprot:XP_023346301.1 band 7 protein AGAP004871-like [Eurytemora affinis]